MDIKISKYISRWFEHHESSLMMYGTSSMLHKILSEIVHLDKEGDQ